MADNFISGNEMYVMLDSIEYSFGKWKLSIKGGNKKFFASGSRFQRTLPGGVAGIISSEGTYNRGNMPLEVGVVYEFHLGIETGDEFVLFARLADVDYDNAVEAGGTGATCSITADSEGDFDIALV